MLSQILTFFYEGVLTLAVQLLPHSDGIPNTAISALTFLYFNSMSLNFMFPMEEIFALLSVSLLLETGLVIFKFSRIAINWLRGSGA